MSRSHKWATAWLVLVAVCAMGGCGSAQEVEDGPPLTPTRVPPTATREPTPTPDFVASYTDEGWEALWSSDFSGAEGAFRAALQFDEEAVEPNMGLATLYYYLVGREADSVAAAERAVELAPESAEAQSVLARSYWNAYRFEESLLAAERAVELAPDCSDAHAALSRILGSMYRQDEALEAALRAVELDSGNSVAHHELAIAYTATRQKNRAIAERHMAAALSPDFASRWVSLAYHYHGWLDEPIRAREYLSRALELAPDYAFALGALADLEADVQEFGRAMDVCGRIQNLAPEAGTGPSCLANVYMAQASYDRAVEAFEETLQIQPDSPWLRTGLAEALAMTGACGEAYAESTTVIESYPWYAPGHAALANAALCGNDPEEAMVHAEDARDLDPYSGVPLRLIGAAHFALDELDEAEAVFLRATELDPDDAGAFARLAYLVGQQGRAAEAIRHFEHAIALDPDEATHHADFGWYLIVDGDYGRGLEHLELALDLGDKREMVYVGLGMALRGIGSYREAHEILAEGMGEYPDSTDMRENLGHLLVAEERCEEAIAEYEWVLRRNPESDLAQAGHQLCEQVLNPTEPSSAPIPAGGVSHDTAGSQAAAVVVQAGGTFVGAMVEPIEGADMWMVAYSSAHVLDSPEFQAQQRKIVLDLSSILVRLEPPTIGLIVVSQDGSGEAGSVVGVVTEMAELWEAGRMSEEEFIGLWLIRSE